MKYIILDDGEIPRGFTFPDTAQHVDVANALKRFGIPIGAGFIVIQPDEGSWIGSEQIRCHGESDSLGIKSKPLDAEHFEGLIQ